MLFGSKRLWQVIACCILSLPSQAQLQTQLPGASSQLQAVSLLGQVSSANASCTSTGQQDVSLLVELVPSNFTLASFTCVFSAWSVVEQIQQSLPNGSTLSVEASAASTSFFSAPSTDASLQLQASWSQDQHFFRCNMPGGLGLNASVGLLARPNGLTGASYLALPKGTIQQTLVQSISPTLGPASGGTDIVLQGAGLSSPMQCTFSNVTQQLSVQAAVLNGTTATCQAPAWTAGRDATPVQLSLANGQCISKQLFVYYEEPQIRAVQPQLAPRYGSFQMMVHVEDDLQNLTREHTTLKPVIRLKGGEGNGTDLVLPAELTGDRRTLIASTPVEKSPYAAGSHEIHLSLNGQQFMAVNGSIFSSAQDMVVSLEGPTLSMAEPIVTLGADQQSVHIPVSVLGNPSLPVSAYFSAQLQQVHNSTHDMLDFRLGSSSLSWQLGQNHTQNLSLTLEPGLDLSAAAVVVSLNNATNADVDVDRTETLITAIPPTQLLRTFTPAINQVAYPGDNVTVPVSISGAALNVPSVVSYTITALAGDLDFIPTAQQTGTIRWDGLQQSRFELVIPVDWDAVPLAAEDRLAVSLRSVWLSRVQQTPNATNMHLFGVAEGQCPPGTIRLHTADDAAAPGPAVPAPPPATDARLSALIVQDAAGNVFDLSSPFIPGVMQYAAMVPDNVTSVTLCVSPSQGGAAVQVTDSESNLVPRLPAEPPVQSPSRTRRILTAPHNETAPAPSPAASGVISSIKTLQSPPTASSTAVCQARAWSLEVAPGQNNFQLSVESPGTLASLPASTQAELTLSEGNVSVAGTELSGNGSSMYTLSVIRLAPEEHAHLAELNASIKGSTYSVCSVDPASEGVPEFDDKGVPINSPGPAPLCQADAYMQLNVSQDTDSVILHPSLLFPDVQGLRVEVNGQVLSKGGDVGADQVMDTTAETTLRDNNDFLPVAIILGLTPGETLTVPITILAEDGVTSSVYHVDILRTSAAEGALSAKSLDLGSGSGLGPAVALSLTGISSSKGGSQDAGIPPPPRTQSTEPLDTLPAGWPVPPSREPWCSICPAGWATTRVDAASCGMCPPGRFAAAPQSPQCTSCPNGTYANSWGSSHCKFCISGTFSPSPASRLCTMCPNNVTNLQDGSDDCDVPIIPGTNLKMRYAVIVSFGVYLNGTNLDDVASKVGVNASAEEVLGHLVRQDTALAFNISEGDVTVTGISQVARRVLQVNVSATLEVDVPSGATEEDIDSALEVTNLSADPMLDMLAHNPDKFFGRTTKALDVTAEPVDTPPTRIESRPGSSGHMTAGQIWPLVLSIVAVAILAVLLGLRYLRRYSVRWYSLVTGRCGRCMPVRKGPWQQQVDEPAVEDGAAKGLSGSGLTTRGAQRGFDASPEAFLPGAELLCDSSTRRS